jgi:hypothetical protein
MAETNIISSPHAQALYGDIYPLIKDVYPDLNVMIVTRDFIPGALDAYNAHDFSFYNLCDWPPYTDPMAEAIDARAQLEKDMAEIFFKYATGEDIFIPENQLMAAIRHDHTIMATMVSGAVGAGGDGFASAITLNHYFPDIPGTVGVITMPHEPMDPLQESSGLSGLHSQYLKITATGQDHELQALGHEITHLINRDGAEKNPDDPYYCSRVNVSISDASARHEAEADVGGAAFIKAAEQRGLTSGADFNTEIAHLRSIRTLMLPSNGYTVTNNEYMVGHLTNTGFDPAQKDFREAFNFSALDGISTLPLLINNYADTLAGFVKAEEIKGQIEKIPGFFSEEDIAFYEGLPDYPSQVADYTSSFAWIGQNTRLYEREPQYHYAAIKYMQENGHFEDIKATLKPEYAAAVDDMVDDYLKGIEAVSTGIVDSIDYNAFSQKMAGIDIAAIGNYTVSLANSYQQDPIGYEAFRGLDATLPRNIFK